MILVSRLVGESERLTGSGDEWVVGDGSEPLTVGVSCVDSRGDIIQLADGCLELLLMNDGPALPKGTEPSGAEPSGSEPRGAEGVAAMDGIEQAGSAGEPGVGMANRGTPLFHWRVCGESLDERWCGAVMPGGYLLRLGWDGHPPARGRYRLVGCVRSVSEDGAGGVSGCSVPLVLKWEGR